MSKARTIIFRTSLIIILLSIVGTIIPLFYNLEFVSSKLEGIVFEIWVFLIPIAILSTLTGTINSIDNTFEIIVKSVFTAILAVGSFWLQIMFLYIAIQGNHQEVDEIYTNIDQDKEVIVGYYTPENPNDIAFKKRTLVTPLFYHYSDFDTLTIDKTKWLKLEKKYHD